MYVTKIVSAKESGAVKKKLAKAGVSNFSELVETSDSEEAKVASSTSVGNINQLLFLQEVGDEQAKKRQVIDQGFDALKYLDHIRIGLLSGVLPMSTIMSLEQVLQKFRKDFVDPYLREVIDEIELRAKVEIAKLTSSQ